MDPSKFFSKFEQDWGQLKPMFYGIEIDVPVIDNGQGRGTITLNNQPYLLTRITHQIVGATFDWQTTGLYQDDQYAIEFRDENSNYQNIPCIAGTIFGSARMGVYPDLPVPLAYSGNRTLSFQITNRYTRVLTPQATYFKVAITLIGVADWGQKVGNLTR
jgi:hypothetical protein